MCSEVTVNSPALMNPKRPVQKAAQSIVLSKVIGCLDRRECMLLNKAGVTGKR